MVYRSLIITLLYLVSCSPAAGQQRILGIDVNWNGAVIQLDGETAYHVFSMDAPARLVIDLKNATLKKGMLSVDARTGPVLRVRSAPRHEHDQRIVFDLRHRIEPQVHDYTDAEGRRHLVVQFNDEQSSPDDLGVAAALRHDPAVPAGEASSCPNPAKPGDFVLAIDAGHGGHDTGAIGRHGIKEKDVTLAIARRLYWLLSRLPSVHGVLIREQDEFVNLQERYRRAQACGAGLLISIHADALPSDSIKGASVYVYSTRRSRGRLVRASWPFGRFPQLLRSANGGVLDAVSRLTADSPGAASYAAAFYILGELGDTTGLLRRKVLQGRFVVLSSGIPSVLVETGFLSHPREELQLSAPLHQRRLARALFDGIMEYVDLHYRTVSRPRKVVHIAGTRSNLRELSRRYEVSVAALRLANGVHSDTLRPGDVMRIPLAHASLN